LIGLFGVIVAVSRTYVIGRAASNNSYHKKYNQESDCCNFFHNNPIVLTVKLPVKIMEKKQIFNDQAFFSVCSVSSVEE